MQAQDLQQIGQLMDEKLKENNKSLEDRLGQKMDDKFKENNKVLEEKITKKIDDKIDELAITVHQAFSEQKNLLDAEFAKVDKNFKEVKDDLAKRPTLEQIMSWGDRKIVSLEMDMDKTKYLHREEWKKLPSTLEISQTLVNDGLKPKL